MLKHGLSKVKLESITKTKTHDDRDSNLKQSFKSSSTGSRLSQQEFTLSAKSLLPLVTTIQQENEQLQAQKQKMIEQMHLIQEVSKDLLSENQALKKHFKQRFEDLQRLVKTFGINHSHTLDETNQLIDSYRFNNEKMYKTISELSKETFLNIKEKEKLQRIQNQSHQNLLLQKNDLYQKLANVKQSQKKMELINFKFFNEKLNLLQNQIDSKVLSISEIRAKNLISLKMIHEQKQNACRDRPNVKSKTVNVLKNIRNLRKQLEEMREESRLLVTKNQELCLQKSKIQIIQENQRQKYLKKQHQLQQLTHNQQLKVSVIKQLVKKLQIAIADHSRAQKKKLQIKNKVQRKKQQLHQKKRNRKDKVAYLESQYNRKIKKLKDMANEQNSTLSNPESASTDQTLQQLHDKYEQCQTRISELQKIIQKQTNPIKQIMDGELKIGKIFQQLFKKL